MLNPSENPFTESPTASCEPLGFSSVTHPPPPPSSSSSSSPPKRPDTFPLAKFVVKTPVRGASVVRPPTLFPIVTTVSGAESAAHALPDVPVAPRQSRMEVGVQRCKWAPSSPGEVDRRYSELVDLRALFAYQFPTIIVPPLPPKSKLESIDTYMTNGNVLIGQQHSIVRFLREVAMTPELIYFSSFTPNFFQLPREAFEGWFATARATLEQFRQCNAGIDAYSTRHGGILGSASVAAITNTSARAVRKLVGFLHSWVGGDSAESPAAKPKPSPPPKPQSVSYRAEDVGERTEDYVLYWTCATRFLEETRNALMHAAEPYLRHLGQRYEMITAEKEVAAALEHYVEVLAASPANAELTKVAREAAFVTGDAAMSVDALLGQNKREMHGRLMFEISYLEAALDAVDHVMCLWRNCEALVGDRTYRENVLYAQAVSKRLRVFYETRFLRSFRFRMQDMIERNANTSLKFAVALEKVWKSAAITRTIADPEYLVYEHSTPVQEEKIKQDQ